MGVDSLAAMEISDINKKCLQILGRQYEMITARIRMHTITLVAILKKGSADRTRSSLHSQSPLSRNLSLIATLPLPKDIHSMLMRAPARTAVDDR